MLRSYKTQMDYLLEDGALPQEIDAAITGFGFPMGLYAMGDLAGLDIGYMTRTREDATRPTDARYAAIADRLYESGPLGPKTGSGCNRSADGRTTTPLPAATGNAAEESPPHAHATRPSYAAPNLTTRH